MVLSQSKFFDQSSHGKKNEKLKTKLKERLVELTEKYLKIEENVNIYDCWTNWKIYKNREIYKRSTLF